MRLRRNVRFVSTLFIVSGCLLWGCSNDGDDSGNRESVPDTSAQMHANADSGESEIETKDIAYKPVDEKWDLDGKPLSVGGLTYRPASQWTDHGVQNEKAALYTYGPLQEDDWPARVAVYFVPADKAAEYKDYFGFWLDRIDNPHLDNPESAAIRHDREVDGMTAHVQSLFGTYLVPQDEYVEGQPTSRPHTRFLGIVVEAPEGLVLLELVGPDYTARVMIEAFMNGIYQLKQNM